MTQPQSITQVIFLIFTGTAVVSTLALFTRQSLLVAYMFLGALLGPWGLKLVNNTDVIKEAGDVGIIFLLFLLGLHLQPQSLFHSLRKMSLITLSSSFLFFAIGFIFGCIFGFGIDQSLIIGGAAMFSSTIIGIKLLPTTTLHHQHTGELVVSILLLQDIVAILMLLALEVIADRAGSLHHLILILSAFPILLLVAFTFERYIISPLIERFDKIHEYIFILSIGWCLFLTELSLTLGLSAEIGAFMAGIALATHPISFYIAENLKPLRDFFLIIFFFTIGAGFDFGYLPTVALPASILALLILVLKPLLFKWLLRSSGEVKKVSWEVGIRLGQMSEFSLLIIYMALGVGQLTPEATYMVEAAVILTFIVSCYWIVMYYPTPLASSDKLRRD